ncbi:MAG: ribosome small subunit-dependent GTPase A [Pseudomarimonas sp.]
MNSTTMQDNPLSALGWQANGPAAQALAHLPPGRLARVIEQHRSGYKVTDGVNDFPVQSPTEWARRSVLADERAAVGDWVWLEPTRDHILRWLPRHSLLSRGAAGEHYKMQLIAANIDAVIVVVGLDGDFNPRRLERYLLLTRGSGAVTVFVLTKVDTCTNVEVALAQLDGLREQGCPVLALNAKDPASAALLAPWTGPGSSVVLVGSSGAGKSTLTNCLLGIERQKTAEVRSTDSRGRHTTTYRSLIGLPSGGCLIDTPGMRELKLTGEEDLAEGGFEDVEAVMGQCRFNDCAHESEPGCAVLAALESGVLTEQRLAHYFKLQGELAAAAGGLAAQRARRAVEKVANKNFGKRLTEKYGKR